MRDAFRNAGSAGRSAPVPRAQSIPLQSDAPEGWRTCECLVGSYVRFALRYPRSWHALSPLGGDPVRLQPDPRASLDVAITVTSSPEPVVGPQGILDAIGQAAEMRGVPFLRSCIELDRWGEDAWAGSLGWTEAGSSEGARAWWLMVVGHDQETVFLMVNGDRAHFEGCQQEILAIAASLRLPPAEVLAPEHFPRALCELLNDRRFRGDAPWTFTERGHLCSGDLVVRLWDIYRAYLHHRDLDAVAATLDAQARRDIEGSFGGRDWADVRDRLRVVLRRGDTLEGLGVVQIPISGGLVACPVLDAGDRMVFIPTEETQRWGLDAQDLLTRAVASLDSEGTATLVEVRDDEDGSLRAFRIADDDGYDSGRLLCPTLRASLEELLGGPLIVALPSAGLVLVARDDAASRQDLAVAADAGFHRRPRPLSDGLWRWTTAGLEPLVEATR